jgi:protein-S-isoprenylcysteine O-methyltransferase Ste14
MTFDDMLFRRAVVAASGLIYWGGVLLLARRIRRQIGRSPNLKPRGGKEKILWAAWLLVIATWIIQPLFVGSHATALDSSLAPAWLQPAGFWLGLGLVAGGYAATLWCYSIMGNAWRIGINPKERNSLITAGPYARVRHPIYAFQMVMLAGVGCLLPTLISLLLLVFHLGCVWIKARDEEVYLTSVHGDDYRAYSSRTGRLFPRIG